MILNTDERMDIILRAIGHYGRESQIDKAIEEMGELIQALSKCKRFGDLQSHVNVIEETADVYIMMLQLIAMFGVNESDNMIDVKLVRLKGRMDAENENDRNNRENKLKDFLVGDAPGDQAGA